MESTAEDKEKEIQSMVEDYASYFLERKNKIEQLSSLLVFVYISLGYFYFKFGESDIMF